MTKAIERKSEYEDDRDENDNDEEYKKIPKESFSKKFKKNLAENLLLIATVFAVLLGIGIGFLLRYFDFGFNENDIDYFGFIGQLFLRMLKFLILPLIGSSLISGIAGLGTGGGGKIAARALIYYFLSTFTAVVIGIILVVSIKPGSGVVHDSDSNDDINHVKVEIQHTLLDLVRNLFPDNIIEMTFQQYETKMEPRYSYDIYFNNGTNITDASKLPFNFTNSSDSGDGVAYKVIRFYRAVGASQKGLNVLGLILFCFVFGAVLANMGKEAEILIKFFEALNEASVRMIKLVMFFSPFGIFSLVLATILEMKDPAEVFERISLYMVTVIVGLLIHGAILLPLVFIIITRRNILTYTKNLLDPLLIALATASSTAALPSNLSCSEERNKINKNISRFVLPVGATINMNGTALYEAVAVIFIAQLNNRDLSFIDLALASITATLASIGAASVPSAGLVTMIIILNALSLPTSQISLIYTVDWFLDRLRTTINVWGDSIGAGIVDHLSKKEISEMLEQQKKDKIKDKLNKSKDEEKDGLELLTYI